MIKNNYKKSDAESYIDKAGQVAKKITNLEVIRDLDEITQMLR